MKTLSKDQINHDEDEILKMSESLRIATVQINHDEDEILKMKDDFRMLDKDTCCKSETNNQGTVMKEAGSESFDENNEEVDDDNEEIDYDNEEVHKMVTPKK
ncbi:hypothetical protein QE152_g10903 [Popillia japonica]|uniref:Uncharacterized protein n=1 Tax=Popillia japonica TaxID=7064 RepID=A0AAW1LTD4_POPJA